MRYRLVASQREPRLFPEANGCGFRDDFPGEITMSVRRFLAVSAFSLVVVLGMVSYPTAVRAQQGFQPISPEELKMTSEPQAPGAPAIILYRQVDRDDNARTPHEDNYFRIKILTEEGRKYADVEIPFFKANQDVVHIRARTIKPDGAIVNFDGQVFEKSIVKSRGFKYLAKTFTLPDVQVGGIIEYYYTVDMKENFIYDSHWILSHELFTKSARFSLKPYITTSATMNLRWTWQGLQSGSEPKQDPADRYHIVRMEASNIAAFQTEDFMPPEDELKSRVDFIYDRELFAKDADTFWKRVGKERNNQLESFIGKRKAMEEAVAQIVSPTDPPETKLRKIYDRVQHIRNTTYEIQKTKQEEKRAKEKAADNVEDIWKRGYGDGVQLTWLFLALARATGLEAYGCMVSDRSNYFFSPKTMQSEKLDANVVLVKLNGKDLYFDPGAAFTPYGLLTWYETGTSGLRLDKNGGTWITTTLPLSSESRIERNAKLKLSDTGDLEGPLTVSFTGLEAMYRRLEFRNADEVSRKKFLEDEVKGQVPAAVEVDLTNKPDWSGSETPLVAEFQIKVPGWVAGAGKRAVMPAGVFTAAEKSMFEHAKRVHPVYFQYPFEKVDDVTIDMPLGWQASSLPRGLSDDGHVITYSMKVDNAKNTLRLQRKLSVDFMILDQQYYPALRHFFQTVRTGDEQQIVLQPM
jgi:transglutaminase-like putative cysteine protease